MAIKLASIGFYYPDRPDHPVLNIPQWSLNDADQVLVCGSSGEGKSTLLSLISGLYVPNAGEVTVLGQSLNSMNNRQRDRFRAENIGYVFQQFNLIPYLNAIDNVLLAASFSLRQNTNALKAEIKTVFDGLNISEKDWCRPTRELSIGQQQRVAIARALINKPKIFIADEPTSSLDDDNKHAFMQLLMPMVTENKMTLLFVSHDKSLSSYFEKVESLSDFNLKEDFE